MDLIPNGLYQCSAAPGEVPNLEPGLYRVVLSDPSLPKAGLVFVQPLDGGSPRLHGGRRKLADGALKRRLKKVRPASVGQIYWVPTRRLEEVWDSERLRPIELDRIETPDLNAQSTADYERRVETMEVFLDLPGLQRSILVHGDLRGLVRETLAKFSCSRSYIYKLWSLMCRFGFTATSLWPQRHRCGAPGVVRRCDVDSNGKATRRKAGRREPPRLSWRPVGVSQTGRV